MSSGRGAPRRRRATVAGAIALGGWLVATAAVAQPTGLDLARERLRERALAAVAECPRGAVIVRPRALPEGAADPGGLASALLAPAVDALEAEQGRAHLGSFGGDGPLVAGRLGYQTLLDVELSVERGHLVARLSSFSTEDARRRGRASVRQRIDPSLRRFLGYPAVVTEETVDARFGVLPGRGYLAVSAADLDGDGGVEVVAVHADGPRVFRVRPGRRRHSLEELGRAAWPDDLPPSPSPRRRTLATALARGRAVVIRHSDHAAPIEVTWADGAVVARRADGPCPDDRYPVRGSEEPRVYCARLVDGRDFFDNEVERGGAAAEVPMHFYALAGRRLEARDGARHHLDALVNPAGRLVLRARVLPPPAGEGEAAQAPAEHSAGALGYGTALAMGDIDMDGAAELLLSHAAAAGAGDQLSLLRMFPRGALRVVWRSEVLPGSVWVAGAGDVDGDGVEELFAIEEPQDPTRGRARLWIVQ